MSVNAEGSLTPRGFVQRIPWKVFLREGKNFHGPAPLALAITHSSSLFLTKIHLLKASFIDRCSAPIVPRPCEFFSNIEDSCYTLPRVFFNGPTHDMEVPGPVTESELQL